MGGIPGDQHPFAIGLREERDLREPFVDVCGHVLQEDGEGALELENPGLIEDRGPVRPVTGPSVARDRDREVVVRGVARCVPLHDPDGQPHVPATQLRRASHEGARIRLPGLHALELVQHGPKRGVHAVVSARRYARRDLKGEEPPATR